MVCIPTNVASCTHLKFSESNATRSPSLLTTIIVGSIAHKRHMHRSQRQPRSNRLLLQPGSRRPRLHTTLRRRKERSKEMVTKSLLPRLSWVSWLYSFIHAYPPHPFPASAPQIPAPAPAQKPHTSSWMKNAAAHIPQILSGSNNQSITASKGTTKSQRSTAAVQVPPLTVQTNAAATAVAPASPAVCGIPGCEEYAYVDAAGQQTSDYCSMSHRE